MAETPTLIVINKYYSVSFYCDDLKPMDNRLRYPTGVRATESISKAGQEKIDQIKDDIMEYVSTRRRRKKTVLKLELKTFLDEQRGIFLPLPSESIVASEAESNVALEAIKDLVQDHKDMIAQMRKGNILKKDGGVYSPNACDQYERIRARWQDCEIATKNAENKFTLSYLITIDDCKALQLWLTQQKYSKNTIYDTLNVLKIYLKWSHKEKYHQNEVFKEMCDRMSFSPEVADAIAPSFDEVYALYTKHFDNTNEERARDFFILGCFLGLRVNDLYRINDYLLLLHSDGYYYFDIFTQKGQKTVSIPAHYIAREIYNKYRGNKSLCGDNQFGPFELSRIPKQWRKLYKPGLLPVFHKSNLAQYLPKICKETIKGSALITMTKGGIKEAHHYERCDLMTPHTMRRFFATYMYCDMHLSAAEVMEFTGHKTEESFFRYIKIDRQRTVKKVANMIAFTGPVELSSNLSVVA